MSNPRFYTRLPAGEKFQTRLEKMQIGLDEQVGRLFNQCLIGLADQAVSGQSLVILLGVVIYRFTKTGDYGPNFYEVLLLCIPQIIDALVDDKGVVEEAKRYYEEVLASMSKTKN